MLTEDISAAFASVPALAIVETAAKSFVASVEAALPAADRSTFETLFTAAVSEIASLANPDPSTAARLKGDVKTVLGKVGHLFGMVARDVADAVDPTASEKSSAPSAAAQAPAVSQAAKPVSP